MQPRRRSRLHLGPASPVPHRLQERERRGGHQVAHAAARHCAPLPALFVVLCGRVLDLHFDLRSGRGGRHRRPLRAPRRAYPPADEARAPRTLFAHLQTVGVERLHQLRVPIHGDNDGGDLSRLPLDGMRMGPAGILCTARVMAAKQGLLRALGPSGRGRRARDARDELLGDRERRAPERRPLRDRHLHGRGVLWRLQLRRCLVDVCVLTLLCRHDHHLRRVW